MYSHEITVLNSSEHRQSIAAVIWKQKTASTEITDRGSADPKTPRFFAK